MARCVKCGEEAAEPVWAVYADPAFDHKPRNDRKDAFALHPECWNDGDVITPLTWVGQDEAGDREVLQTADENSDNPTVLVAGEPYARYRQVEAP